MFITTGSRLPEIVYSTSFISTRPWPEVKLVTRPPATANPSQTVAAECSLSGSKNMSGSPQRFFWPFVTAALKPPPMVVELVMGYAPAACATLISTWTTASAPSQVVGMPGYSYLVSDASRTGSVVRGGACAITLLMTHSLSGQVGRLSKPSYGPNPCRACADQMEKIIG